jgi:hypothetical protein
MTLGHTLVRSGRARQGGSLAVSEPFSTYFRTFPNGDDLVSDSVIVEKEQQRMNLF